MCTYASNAIAKSNAIDGSIGLFVYLSNRLFVVLLISIWICYVEAQQCCTGTINDRVMEVNGIGQAVIETDWTEIRATVEIRNETRFGKQHTNHRDNSFVRGGQDTNTNTNTNSLSTIMININNYNVIFIFILMNICCCCADLSSSVTLPNYMSDVQTRASKQMQNVMNYLNELDAQAGLTKLKTTRNEQLETKQTD
jgi:hypothetical protein